MRDPSLGRLLFLCPTSFFNKLHLSFASSTYHVLRTYATCTSISSATRPATSHHLTAGAELLRPDCLWPIRVIVISAIVCYAWPISLSTYRKFHQLHRYVPRPPKAHLNRPSLALGYPIHLAPAPSCDLFPSGNSSRASSPDMEWFNCCTNF